MAEHGIWSARLEAADRRLAELQAELDVRDAALQQAQATAATASHHLPNNNNATSSFRTWAAARSASISPIRRPHAHHTRTSAHASPQQAAASIAAAAATQAATATVAAARAAMLAQSSAKTSACLAAAAGPTTSTNSAAATSAAIAAAVAAASFAEDDVALQEKQAQLQSALQRAKQMGSLLHSKGSGLKAEVRHAQAALAAAEAVAQAKDDILQARQIELATTRADLSRTREDLVTSKLTQARLQAECQSLQVKLAGRLGAEQKLESDLACAQSEVSSLRAEVNQLRGTAMVHRALQALDSASASAPPPPISPRTAQAMATMRRETTSLAAELRSLKEGRRVEEEVVAQLRSANECLRQENERLKGSEARTDANQQQMEQVLRASRKLQDALRAATSSIHVLQTRAEGAEEEVARRASQLGRLERENRQLGDKLRAAMAQVEDLADMQRSSAVAAGALQQRMSPPRSLGAHSGVQPYHLPSSGASAAAAGEGVHPRDLDTSFMQQEGELALERYRHLKNELRAAQTDLAATESRGAGAQARAQRAEQHVASLQQALNAATVQIKQQEALRAQLANVDKASESDKARLASVSAELAAKTTELARYRSDLERASLMMEDSRAVQAQLAEQLQKTTGKLHRLTSQQTSGHSPSHTRDTSPAPGPHPTYHQLGVQHNSSTSTMQQQGGGGAGEEGEEDLSALLEYMEYEMSMLAGSVADREAAGMGLKARMAAVRKMLAARGVGGGGAAGGRPGGGGTVPAAWGSPEHGGGADDGSQRGPGAGTGRVVGVPPCFPAAPTSGQCSPTVVLSGRMNAGATSGTDSGAAGQRASTWGRSGGTTGASSRLQHSQLADDLHSMYTVPQHGGAGAGGGAGGMSESSTPWSVDPPPPQYATHRPQPLDLAAASGDSAAAAGGGGINVKRLLSDAANAVASANVAMRGGGGSAGSSPVGASGRSGTGTGIGGGASPRDVSGGLRMLHAYQSASGSGRFPLMDGQGGAEDESSRVLASRMAGLDNALAALAGSHHGQFPA